MCKRNNLYKVRDSASRFTEAFLALLCLILARQEAAAVVNNAQPQNVSVEADKAKEPTPVEEPKSNNTSPEDLKSEASEQNANRRDAPLLGLSDSYGLPIPSDSYGPPLDTYVPPAPSNIALPVPVYGAPDSNVIYPAPPPDIPPPLPLQTYGPPQQINLQVIGPPKEAYGPPRPPPKYGPPPRPVKPFIPPKNIKPLYGPPRPPLKFNLGPKFPKPKPLYGPPKLPKPFYGPPKGGFLSPPPKSNYGPPKFNGYKGNFGKAPISHYGPPEPIPQRPPPGVPAPPTPPDIKYDGWQPIPGLVSRPPSDSYGVPESDHAGGGDLQLNADFVPPPENVVLPQEAYGAPLGDAHAFHDDSALALAGIGQDQQLSVIKSVGIELTPNAGNIEAFVPPIGDSYGAPPLNAFSPDGPYAAAHTYNGLGAELNLGDVTQGFLLPPANPGLIPPSGLYGVPPSGEYGTPLLQGPNLAPSGQYGAPLLQGQNLPPSGQYGAPPQGHALNALAINQPKKPVVFREPVPVGLIESVGNQVAQKDAQGIIEHDSAYHSRPPTYIPPPIPDVSKQAPPQPSSLYSLPSAESPASFQKIALGSSTSGLSNFGGAQALPLTSYTAPLGIVDGSYGLPSFQAGTSVGLDTSHAASTIDLTGINLDFNLPHDSQASAAFPVIQSVPYDCTNHKSQPLVAPSAHGDLSAEYSQKVNVIENNAIEHAKEPHGKSMEQIFGPGSELIKSQSLDFNNIPVKGTRGSYTLQIQSAGGKSGNLIPVPHDQVLSEGLLQSILAAIEGPAGKASGVTEAAATDNIALYFRNSDVSQSANKTDNKKN